MLEWCHYIMRQLISFSFTSVSLFFFGHTLGKLSLHAARSLPAFRSRCLFLTLGCHEEGRGRLSRSNSAVLLCSCMWCTTTPSSTPTCLQP